MPELPEVETVRSGLEPQIKNRIIKNVIVNYEKMVSPKPPKFIDELKNKTIEDIRRRGKYLLFDFSGDVVMISHLRMEGKYAVVKRDEPYKKHDHVIFELDNGMDIRYNDTRKFGRMNLVPAGAEFNHGGLKTIGPEPTEKDLTFDYLKKTLAKHHRMIKSFLLDQSMIAGLGNIYTDEVLWMSKIHPKRMTDSLSDREIKDLRSNIIDEIKKAIAAQGTTVFSYLNANGHAGTFQNQLNVYHQQGKPCPRCQTTIEKIKVAQRGTHFCPNCQRLDK